MFQQLKEANGRDKLEAAAEQETQRYTLSQKWALIDDGTLVRWECLARQWWSIWSIQRVVRAFNRRRRHSEIPGEHGSFDMLICRDGF